MDTLDTNSQRKILHFFALDTRATLDTNSQRKSLTFFTLDTQDALAQIPHKYYKMRSNFRESKFFSRNSCQIPVKSANSDLRLNRYVRAVH